LQCYARAAATLHWQIERTATPSAFADVQALYVAAAAETAAAVQLASDNFAITPLAASHFDQSLTARYVE
jgi:hypothetical protein